MLHRKFTLREKIPLAILAILLVGVTYYFMLWQPCADAVAEAQIQVQNVDTEMMVEQVKAARLAQMQEALDGLGDPDHRPAAIARYDNVVNVARTLNAALAAADDYQLTFRDVEVGENDNIVRRGVDMTFRCSSYAQARSVIAALYRGPYRCEIGGFSLQAEDEDAGITGGALTARLSITFYELDE